MKRVLFLSVLGLLFSGYLTYSKLFSNQCVLATSCLEILGIPSCVFGFIGFLLLTGHIVAKIYKGAFVISVLGFIMAIIFTLIELFQNQASYTLFLPTCFWGGLIFGSVAWLLKDKAL